MIDYHTFSRIRDMHTREGLTAAQIAADLGLDVRTVSRQLKNEKYMPRKEAHRAGKLDPFKPEIVRLISQHSYSAEQIFQRIGEMGFDGGKTIVKDFVAQVRPSAIKAYLSIQYDKGSCAQIDWGVCGTIGVGETRRKLHFFTMVLGYSRALFVCFTVQETMEQFLECMRLGFNYFGGVPHRLVIDNLKTGVLSHQRGMPPVFHPRFVEMGEHYGFAPVACNPRSPQEKGMVEKSVSYVKGNFLNGHGYSTLGSLQAAGVKWLNDTANDRIHSVTGKRPFDLLAEEHPLLARINPMPYDTSVVRAVRASSQFRVTLDANRYSVPWRLAGKLMQVKVHMDYLSIFHDGKLVARHPRSYDRRRDFENPDHVNGLLAYKKNGQRDKLLVRFLEMHPCVEEYYRNLCQVRAGAAVHVRKIMALHDVYGCAAVVHAIQAALHFHAFSSDYILHLLEQNGRADPKPGPLHLTTPGDALDLDIATPDLNRYTP